MPFEAPWALSLSPRIVKIPTFAMDACDGRVIFLCCVLLGFLTDPSATRRWPPLEIEAMGALTVDHYRPWEMAWALPTRSLAALVIPSVFAGIEFPN